MKKVFAACGADARRVVVHYVSEFREYRARFYEGSLPREECDYFTDDEDDAIFTAQVMLRTVE